jgi:hypothetical protein
LADALALVDEAAKRLWTPEGRAAMAYLEGRGLTEATIRAARLGWTPRVMLSTSDGARFWRASGVVIPWFDGGRLAMVKIRQPEGSRPKYAEAFRDRPTLYPSPEAIRPGTPLIVVEGEFDALLLAQELADLACVITTGSASNRLDPSTLAALLRCPRWYAAHDADEAGDRSAAEWPARAVRVRPPAGKDWTDAMQAGVDLRRWWIEEALADAFDREERAAIMEHGGGLTREAAECSAESSHAYRRTEPPDCVAESMSPKPSRPGMPQRQEDRPSSLGLGFGQSKLRPPGVELVDVILGQREPSYPPPDRVRLRQVQDGALPGDLIQ